MKTIYEMTVQELLDAGFSVYASKSTVLEQPQPWLRTDAQKMETCQALVPDAMVIRGWYTMGDLRPQGAHATARHNSGVRVEVSIS